MMPHGQKNQDRNLGGFRSDRSRARGHHLGQVLVHEKEAATTVTAACSFSDALMGATIRENPGPGTPSCPQIPHGISAPSTAMGSREGSQCHGGSSIEKQEGASPSQDKDARQMRMDAFKNEKLDKIVRFLLQKYQRHEHITMEELKHLVAPDAPDDFPVIFGEICESMYLGFGIILKQVDSTAHTYELVSTLGLTYSGILDDTDQIIAKAGLLILILNVVFLQGNRVSEEYLKDILSHRKIVGGRAHIAVEDAWKFTREDLVQADYLVYQQDPNSDPPHYEFVWGPRALAETTRMKVLEHIIMLDEKEPGAYPY